MTTAYQGEPGAFSEEAARALFPDAEPVPCAAFDDVFAAVEAGRVDRGVVPIENSLFGSVHANYDLLQAHDLIITAELRLRIRHHLLALPGVQPAHVRRVYSHPQALGQCADYLKTHLPDAEAVPVYDTAGAAKNLAERDERDAAAIASRRAADVYGLRVLAAGIESHRANYTRFLALARPADASTVPAPAGTAHKTSIVYAMRRNVPGALFKSLAVFALRDLDLYKIESRPLVGAPGEYLFYLDLEGAATDDAVLRALDHLREIAPLVKVLGSYPAGITVGDGADVVD